MSLYPWVLKYCRYPTSHPVKVHRPPVDDDLIRLQPCCGGDDGTTFCPDRDHLHHKLKYFGIASVRILPPQHLLHPVLPYRCKKDGKLKFPLCASCAERNDNDECVCTDEERVLEATYCTPEIEAALDVGYQILSVNEVLHWSTSSKYERKSRNGGLFAEYVNTFLKIKQEASGLPPEEQYASLKEYVDTYEFREGIRLDPNRIRKAAALRTIGKLLLNAFYGKFGQRLTLRASHLVTDIAQLNDILLDPTKRLVDFHILNEDIMHVETEREELFANADIKTNVVIAAFTASWGRLKLWNVMHRLGERLFYTDTDSFIFEESGDDNEWNPPRGEFLGDLSDELSCKKCGCRAEDCEGHWIVEFVACGPKNYAYRLNTGQTVVKVRGFSLNHSASQIINFATMKEALIEWYEGGSQPELITVSTQIARDKHRATVYNRKVPKHYGIVYDKNRVIHGFKTVPHGYRRRDDDDDDKQS